MGPVAQWSTRPPERRENAGSNPAGPALSEIPVREKRGLPCPLWTVHDVWMNPFEHSPCLWGVVAGLVEDAYRVTAPKTLVAKPDARVADPADLPQSSAHGDL